LWGVQVEAAAVGAVIDSGCIDHLWCVALRHVIELEKHVYKGVDGDSRAGGCRDALGNDDLVRVAAIREVKRLVGAGRRACRGRVDIDDGRIEIRKRDRRCAESILLVG
jgi:hypothetical protein